MLIDEGIDGSHPFGAANWGGQPITKRAYFHAAGPATLSTLHLDGSLYHFKKTDRVLGVYAEGIIGFTISDCRVYDLYDGLRFHAMSPNSVTQATVLGCELLSMGPIDFSSSSSTNENQGHAGIWLVGAGGIEVKITNDCRIEGCHDAIEVDGEAMTGRLAISDTHFVGNENGIEAVGSGNLVSYVTDCEFTGNSNFQAGAGMPLFVNGSPNSPGPIAARGMQNTITVRSSMFTDNAFAFFTSSPGTYDFGYTGSLSPGLNVFNFNLPPLDANATTNAVRVAMGVSSTQASVFAGGNTWYHLNLNQGTSAGGCLMGVKTGAAVVGDNLVPSPLNPNLLTAPGPTKGQCCDPATGGDWKRNYSLAPFCSIDFGTGCLP